MTDQLPEQQPEAGEAPVPGAAPAPAPATEPPQEEPMTPDQSGRAAELEAELAKIRADAARGAKVLLRVLRPHISFTHAGITVGAEPTPVPERAVGPLLTAAGEAGVTIEEA